MKKHKSKEHLNKQEITMAYAYGDGEVYDFPGLYPAFRSGRGYVVPKMEDLIPLPEGSYLFTLPERHPVFYNQKQKYFRHITVDYDGEDIFAVSSFLASGYLRTHLPAFVSEEGAPMLTMWAYAGVTVIDGEFYVPAVRIDEDPRSDFAIHQNHEELKQKTTELINQYPENRLVKQLQGCATEYNCLCSRNFFLSRYEAPLPTSPACNARCTGCLSYQDDESEIVAAQNRLSFKPTPEEIAEVILHHFERVPDGVASFGQGCEGEPLLRANDLAKAIELVRSKTDKGTINCNTNGSLPDAVKLLIDSGIDSIRVSMNSPTEKYYSRYYKPRNYTFSDIAQSVDIALQSDVFTSINLFFLPGFTDMETEVANLFTFLDKFPVDMIQTRNLNIDPDFYLDEIGFVESKAIGVKNLLAEIRNKYPKIRLGYYNPALR